MDKRIHEREVIIDPLKRWAEYYFSDVSCGWPVEPDHESLFHMFGWNHRMRYNSDLQYLESLDSSEEISVLSHYAGEKFMNILIVRAEPRIGVYTPVATMFNGVLKFNDMANLPHLFRGTRITITRKDSITHVTVESATNYGSVRALDPDWYIECKDEHGRCLYWKQKIDGGSMELGWT